MHYNYSSSLDPRKQLRFYDKSDDRKEDSPDMKLSDYEAYLYKRISELEFMKRNKKNK